MNIWQICDMFPQLTEASSSVMVISLSVDAAKVMGILVDGMSPTVVRLLCKADVLMSTCSRCMLRVTERGMQ